MKNATIRSMFIVLMFFGSLIPKQGHACIDYANSIYVTCEYDSSTFNNIMLTVHNMELFGGPTGAFCTCALQNYTDIFSEIMYVAFVDSGTLNPIAAFEPWSASSIASSEWGWTWDAFLAEVVDDMITGTPVELVIRAQLPPGWTFEQMDTSLVYTQLGTDEWDNNLSTLAFSHHQVLSVVSGGQPTYVNRDQAYFDYVDLQITGIDDLAHYDSFNVFPNPTANELSIKLTNGAPFVGTIKLYDMLGQCLRSMNINGSDRLITVDLEDLPRGAYSLTIDSGVIRGSRKFVKT